jgi:acyl dehydratase
LPIPSTAVGTRYPPITTTIERGRLCLFAKATGQTDPVYVDVRAARAAGHPDLPVPPTFLFALELEQPDPFGWLRELGVDMDHVLHGSQAFSYTAMAYAGDALTVASTITDVQSKKGGSLELVDRRSEVTRDGQSIAVLEQTIVVRNAVAA